jgi:putative ABC transport system substrate-binding protein
MARIKRIFYRPKQLICRWLLSCIALCLTFFSYPLAAATLAVIYPDLPPPYQQVFEQILEGVEAQHAGKVIKYSIDKPLAPDALLKKMETDGIDRVITLGRRGYAYNKILRGKYPFVTGALPIKPNDISGVSLIADPANLFDQLKILSPNTRQIHVVYTDQSQWLIEKAQRAAAKKKLKLITAKVADLSEAIERYQKIFQEANSLTDAIWLPLDTTTANQNVILPLLLRESWDRNFVVFSSKPGHVRRGFLFTLFPDNMQDGSRLARMVANMKKGEKGPGVELSLTRQVGVNLRTASHLGLEYNATMKNSFYQTFPQSGF